MPDAASTAAVQPPPFILDLRNRSPPASPSQVASDAARSSSPSSLGESEGTASTNATSEAPSDPLREQIIAGLIGSPKPTVPGKTEKDRAYAYRRTIPTMTLYSERGLSIYEEITKTKVCSPFPSVFVFVQPMLSQQALARCRPHLPYCTRACPSNQVAGKHPLRRRNVLTSSLRSGSGLLSVRSGKRDSRKVWRRNRLPHVWAAVGLARPGRRCPRQRRPVRTVSGFEQGREEGKVVSRRLRLQRAPHPRY